MGKSLGAHQNRRSAHISRATDGWIDSGGSLQPSFVSQVTKLGGDYED
jgi:hypothetical protein